jgi:hypothetical protein
LNINEELNFSLKKCASSELTFRASAATAITHAKASVLFCGRALNKFFRRYEYLAVWDFFNFFCHLKCFSHFFFAIAKFNTFFIMSLQAWNTVSSD